MARIIQLASLVAFLSAPLVAADCWKTSGAHADKVSGLQKLNDVKDGLSGNYQNGQVKVACIYDASYRTHYHLTIKRGNGSGYISPNTVHDGLYREMDGCERGGHRWDGEWEYKYVPAFCNYIFACLSRTILS
jgi:hypothetical protein